MQIAFRSKLDIPHIAQIAQGVRAEYGISCTASDTIQQKKHTRYKLTRFECNIDERGDEIGRLAALSRSSILQGADVNEGGQRSAHIAEGSEAALGSA